MANPEQQPGRSKDDPAFDSVEERDGARSRVDDRQAGKQTRYPVIRKPVPISESGPLRPPNPGARSDTPSRDSAASEDADDFGFLDDIDLSPSRANREPEFVEDWERPVGYEDDEPPRLWRRVAFVISICALLTGGFLFSLPWLKQQGVNFDMPEELPFGLTLDLPFDIPGFGRDDSESTDTATAPSESDPAVGSGEMDIDATVESEATTSGGAAATGTTSAPSETQPQASSLGSRFRESLSEIESLVANEQYEQAAQAISTLDRSVYGYGVTEFKALESRIEEVRGASAAAAAEQAAREREAAEAERVRLEAEAEAARQAEQAEARAAEEAQAAEQARVAEAQAELERQQAADRERAETAQNSARDAGSADAEQAAAVQRAEATRLAGENRDAEERRRAIAEQAASDRAATDRAVAEQRAAADRQAQAQQQAQQQRQQEQTVARAPEQRVPAPVNRPITDSDLQLVYGRFSDLAIAIETGNINDVISLTSRSTARIQQFLQLFENSDFVSARITDVATRNASGSVTGTLSISGITRADGSRVNVPSNLRSITLTSQREGNGWSLIDW